MDEARFNALTRTIATRRGALTRLGRSGLGALLLGAAGQRAALAATSDLCTVEIVASVRIGPSTKAQLGGDNLGELRGTLAFSLTDTGRLSNGSMTLADGTQLKATGQATGQALTVRVAIPPDGTLVLIGAGARSITNCGGALDGLLTGPAVGDIGDWHGAAARERTPGSPTVTGAAIPSSSDTAASDNGDDTSDVDGIGATPTCMPRSCGPDDCGRHDDGCGGINICADLCSVVHPSGFLCYQGTCCDTGAVCGAANCGEIAACGGVTICNCFEGSSCAGGICCAATGQSCAHYGCCVGYCGEDGLCVCVDPGNTCATTGTGGCCSGAPCADDGTCP